MEALPISALEVLPPRMQIESLTRLEDILAHLYYAAAEIGTIIVDDRTRSTSAMIAFPEPQRNSVVIHCDEDITPPMPGTTIQIRYHRDNSRYSFKAEIQAVDGRRWRVSFPDSITRHSGRGAERVKTMNVPEVAFYLDRVSGDPIKMTVYDLSTKGMSVIYPTQRCAMRTNEYISGVLVLPEGIRLPVLLDIRHTREIDGHHWLAGCQLIGLSPWGQASLARTLSKLSARNTSH